MASETYTCSVCGAVCAPASFIVGPRLPAVAYGPNDRTYCQACAAEWDRENIRAGGPITAYLSSDGRTITTWAGEVLARVTEVGTSGAGWHGSKITHWRAVTLEGIELYGKNGGRGMATSVHVTAASRRKLVA